MPPWSVAVPALCVAVERLRVIRDAAEDYLGFMGTFCDFPGLPAEKLRAALAGRGEGRQQ